MNRYAYVSSLILLAVSLLAFSGCDTKRARPMLAKISIDTVYDDGDEDKEDERAYEYSDDRLSEIVFERSGEKRSSTKLEYGDSGELVENEATYYPYEDDPDGERTKSTSAYEWEDGRIVKVTVEDPDKDDDVEEELTLEYMYDDGKLTETKYEYTSKVDSDDGVSGSSETTYDNEVKYNDDSQIEEATIVFETVSKNNGEAASVFKGKATAEFEWNDDGELEKWTAEQTNEGDVTSESEREFKFDSDGKVKSADTFDLFLADEDDEEDEDARYEYEYDVSYNDDGFIEEVTVEDEDSTTTYEFDYDDGEFEGDGVGVSTPFGASFDLQGASQPVQGAFFDALYGQQTLFVYF